MRWEVLDVPDDQDMYLKMVRASEEAIQILIAAQRECEELYLEQEEELSVLPAPEQGPEAP